MLAGLVLDRIGELDIWNPESAHDPSNYEDIHCGGFHVFRSVDSLDGSSRGRRMIAFLLPGSLASRVE
jgi:hypothetical protein